MHEPGSNNYEGPRRYKAAAEDVCDFFRWLVDLPVRTEVSIYCWGDHQHGVRVAEVATFLRDETEPRCGGGASYMQSEEEAYAVLFAVERCLITWEKDHTHRTRVNEEPDWFCEALAGLICAVWQGGRCRRKRMRKLNEFWAQHPNYGICR